MLEDAALILLLPPRMAHAGLQSCSSIVSASVAEHLSGGQLQFIPHTVQGQRGIPLRCIKLPRERQLASASSWWDPGELRGWRTHAYFGEPRRR